VSICPAFEPSNFLALYKALGYSFVFIANNV
jgi:hypothetical protein